MKNVMGPMCMLLSACDPLRISPQADNLGGMEHDQVHDPASFADYVRHLRAQLDDPQRAAQWAHTTLPDFLEAMEAWVRDWDRPAQANPWRHAADVLMAASIYE